MSNSTVNSEILNGNVILILITFGTIGNLLNILVFSRMRTLRQMPNSVFLFTSFVGSLMVLWTARFYNAIFNLTGIDLVKESLFYCEFRWLFGRMGSSITMTSLCLVGIDRFFVTSHNVRYRHMFTMKRARLTVMIMILIFLIPLIPDIVYYATPSCTSPGAPFWYRQYTTYFNTVYTNFLPVPVLVVSGTLTWYNLHTARLGQQNRLEMQVNRMILAELVMICFTSIPNIVSTIYSLSTASMTKSPLRMVQDSLWASVFSVFTMSTYCGSFYVFTIVSAAYRKNVRTVLCCMKQNQLVIEIGRSIVPMNSANYYSYQYVPDLAHHFEQQNNDVSPAYPGQSGYLCSQCST